MKRKVKVILMANNHLNEKVETKELVTTKPLISKPKRKKKENLKPINVFSDSKSKTKLNIEKDSEVLLCEKMNFTGREAYKMLRTNLMFALADSPKCKKIGITSSIRGEGKSTVSINLAYTLASANSKVLLVDLDMRLPSIAKKLGLDYHFGLSDYLVNKVTKKDIIHSLSNYKNFDVILCGTIPPNPSELIGSETLSKFVKSLELSYDYIIFDLPPVNIVTDALAAKDLLDGQLIVVREGYSDKYSLSNCIRQLQFVEMNILGFVLANAGGDATYYNKYTRKSYRYKKYSNGYKSYKYGYGYRRNSPYKEGYYK